MNKSEHINELAAALAKAQAKIEAAPKDNTAKVKGKTRAGADIEYSYSYSTLADVWAACRGPLSENGLAIVQTVIAKGNQVTVTTMLAHGSGQWISEELAMSAADERPQSVGSAITYARRYALGAMVGVVSEEDDDGNEAQGNQYQSQRKPPPPVKPNGNGKPAPKEAATPPPAEEQLSIRLIEMCEAGFASERDKAAWQELHRPEVNSLPPYLKKPVVEAHQKAAVRS